MAAMVVTALGAGHARASLRDSEALSWHGWVALGGWFKLFCVCSRSSAKAHASVCACCGVRPALQFDDGTFCHYASPMLFQTRVVYRLINQEGAQ